MPTTGNRPRLGSVPGRCKVDDGERAMNRAWIPAGALAGVSVAGLIALGPLTDSLGTPVTFRPSVAVTTPTRRAPAPARERRRRHAGHRRTTAALVRGGRAAATSHERRRRSGRFQADAVRPVEHGGPARPRSTPPTAKPKKTVKRQTLDRHRRRAERRPGPRGRQLGRLDGCRRDARHARQHSLRPADRRAGLVEFGPSGL